MIAFIVSMFFLAAGVWSAARLDGYSFPEKWKDNALRTGPLPDHVSIEGILTAAESLFGLAAGAAWIASQGGCRASGSITK